MHSSLHPLVVWWLLAAVVCGQSRSAAQDESVGEPCRFSGRVVDVRGEPVAGAVVVHLPDVRTLRAMGIAFGANEGLRFTPEEQGRFRRATCDAEGRFALDSRFVAAYQPEADGVWRRDPSLVVLNPGHAVHARLCSGFSGGEYEAGDIAIEPGGRLVGRVVDERGAPIAGVRIAVDQEGRIRPLGATTADDRGAADLLSALLATPTDASGAFAIEGLWNGSVRLLAWAPRHASTTRPSISVVAETTTDCGDVILPDGGSIAGQVVDESAQPVTGARVFAHWLTPDEQMQLDFGIESDVAALGLGGALQSVQPGERTDSAGRFELVGLEENPLQVLVDADGFEWATLVDIKLGTDPLVVPLVRESRLDVEVVEATNGQPLDDAIVEASRYAIFGKPISLRVTRVSGRKGVFSVHQVHAGSTAIRVSAPGRGRMIHLLTTTAPAGADECTVRLHLAASITGRVVEAGGRPTRGLLMDAHRVGEDDQPFQPLGPESVWTDADGRYRFDGLAGLRWKVVPRTERYEILPSNRECTTQAGLTVTVPDIVVSRGGVLHGTLRSALGQPIAGRELFVLPGPLLGDVTAALNRKRSRTDAAGRFEFSALQPGDWVVVGPEGSTDPLGQARVGWHDRVELNLTAHE